MWESILASSITLIGFIVAFIIIYYLFSFTKMKKQKKYFADLHTGLAVGQKVQLSNGIIGTIKTVGKETLDIEIKSGAIMEVSLYAISQIVA